MGMMGSHHVTFEGECYKLNETTLPFGYIEKGNLEMFITGILGGFFLLLWYHSKMKNKVFLWLGTGIIFLGLFSVFSSYQEKKRIIKEHGTKIECL